METNLNPSKLGTKEYWEDIYERDVKNFENNGDYGEEWFGVKETRNIVKYIVSAENIDKNSPIIDIGCGNGVTLIQLATRNYTNLLGVDYSPHAIQLAEGVSKKEGLSSIRFRVCDILSLEETESLGQFAIAIDKGTYDAVSLTADAFEKREVYVQSVHRLLMQDGLLIITSCNWTDEELQNQFKTHFKTVHVMPKSTFTFGSKTGSCTSTVVFQKKINY